MTVKFQSNISGSEGLNFAAAFVNQFVPFFKCTVQEYDRFS